MEYDNLRKPDTQPRLFSLEESSSSIAELFPEIWAASEDLSNPNPSIRRLALEFLEHRSAARISPLVVYIIATRLDDSDLEVRMRVLRILGGVLSPDALGNRAPDMVTNYLTHNLSNMRTRQVFAILEVLVHETDLAPQVICILKTCPFAGNHLMEMANSRKVPLGMRRKAIWLIGQIGYLDAIPALERMQIRMETRLTGQQNMPFVPPIGVDDIELLEDVKSTLGMLQSP